MKKLAGVGRHEVHCWRRSEFFWRLRARRERVMITITIPGIGNRLKLERETQNSVDRAFQKAVSKCLDCVDDGLRVGQRSSSRIHARKAFCWPLNVHGLCIGCNSVIAVTYMFFRSVAGTKVMCFHFLCCCSVSRSFGSRNLVLPNRTIASVTAVIQPERGRACSCRHMRLGIVLSQSAATSWPVLCARHVHTNQLSLSRSL